MREENTMKKRYAAMILTLPTLAVLALSVFVLGFQGYFAGELIVGIPLYVWYLLGVAGYSVGWRVLLISQSCGRIALGVVLAMFPVVVIALPFFFAK
jgi:ABC-type proline/glycine betaine transport system permease subunit